MWLLLTLPAVFHHFLLIIPYAGLVAKPDLRDTEKYSSVFEFSRFEGGNSPGLSPIHRPMPIPRVRSNSARRASVDLVPRGATQPTYTPTMKRRASIAPQVLDISSITYHRSSEDVNSYSSLMTRSCDDHAMKTIDKARVGRRQSVQLPAIDHTLEKEELSRRRSAEASVTVGQDVRAFRAEIKQETEGMECE